MSKLLQYQSPTQRHKKKKKKQKKKGGGGGVTVQTLVVFIFERVDVTNFLEHSRELCDVHLCVKLLHAEVQLKGFFRECIQIVVCNARNRTISVNMRFCALMYNQTRHM